VPENTFSIMASTSSNLKNDPACVQVYNFAQLAAKHPDYPFPADGRGPFAIWQEGVAPGDMTFTTAEFFLTREGSWLPLSMFISLPVDVRRALCILDSAAEAHALIADLAGPVRIYGKAGGGAE
jgi:hypothetical protein